MFISFHHPTLDCTTTFILTFPIHHIVYAISHTSGGTHLTGLWFCSMVLFASHSYLLVQ